MTKINKIIPYGWPCTLAEAPPGPFISPKFPDLLCFKSEYHTSDGKIEAYNSAGEFYCGTESMIQPVEMVVSDDQD